MKKIYVFFLLIFALANVFGQITVFNDDFSTNQSAIYTTAGGIGASGWIVTRQGADWGARRNTAPAQLELTNDVGATPNANGWVYASLSLGAFMPPYSTTLASNPGIVTWTFNMRTNRTTALSGFGATNSYGIAYILTSTSNTPNTTGNGYAVVMGGGGTNTISLISFTNGLQGTRTTVVAYGGAPAALNNYISVKVTYNPTGNAWELFNRDDGSTVFADPASGSLTSLGTATNSTYTGVAMSYYGAYWQGSTTATQTGFFDNAKVTVVNAAAPIINVIPTSLSGFLSTSGVPSAVQTYTVDGSNLTANISIAPPTGYEISPTGAFTPTNPIVLPQVGGIVSSTTIQVRLNSATLGVNAGNITHTSASSNNPTVAVTGKVLAPEPTVQSTITIGAVTNSTVVVNFGGGNGARRILLAKLAAPVSSDPLDGTTYTANANFGSGTQIGAGNYVVYDGVGNTQLVTGLTAGATYHFAIYDYNNGGVAGAENYLIPGGVNNATLLTYSLPYVWIGLNGDWQVPTNWLPTRLFPATNDSLLFTSASLNDIITNVPTQTVGYIGASLLTGTTLQAAATGNTLTIGNLSGTDFYVEAGSSFNINTANALTLNIVTGATAIINGTIAFTAGAHQLTAADANGVRFNSGAIFNAGTGFTGNPFGVNFVAIPNSVVFANGSTMIQSAGANPFALITPLSAVVFNTGSLFKATGGVGFTPSFSGRTYANVEIDNPLYNVTSIGGNPLSIDNLTVTNGIQNFNLTGGINIKGNISVAAGQTLTFTPASANTLTFNGTTAQSISNAGTLTFGANENVTINNAAGLTLNTPVTLQKILTFTSGLINTTTANLLTLNAAASVTGASNNSFVNGPVSKIGNTLFTFPVGKTNCGPSGTVKGYVALSISAPALVTDQFTAEYVHSSARALGPISNVGINHVSSCDYWKLDKISAAPATIDITLNWDEPLNNCTNATPYINSLATLIIAHFNGASWDNFGGLGMYIGSTTTGIITWTGVTNFSPFSIASSSFLNPLPITINYFTGTKNNGSHLLNWKLTCVTTPSATIELERSTDGRNYSSIYSIFATALRCQQPFNYTDNQPAKGTNYYRLKMTDVDGKVTYSSIVPLINAVKGFDMLNIAPNPVVNSNFNLQISSAEKTQIEIVITDMQGRVVLKQSVNLIAGFNTVPMNVKNLAAATYQLFGNTADERTKVLRFVIQ